MTGGARAVAKGRCPTTHYVICRGRARTPEAEKAVELGSCHLELPKPATREC